MFSCLPDLIRRGNSRDATSAFQWRAVYARDDALLRPRAARRGARGRAPARVIPGGVLATRAPAQRVRGAAHHSKMGSDMATREFGRQGGLVRGFLGVAPRRVQQGAARTVPESAAHRTGVGRSRVVPLARRCDLKWSPSQSLPVRNLPLPVPPSPSQDLPLAQYNFYSPS